MTEKFVTVDEAKDALCIGTTALYALMKAGELRRIKLGRRTVLAQSDIQAFMVKKLEEATV